MHSSYFLPCLQGGETKNHKQVKLIYLMISFIDECALTVIQDFVLDQPASELFPIEKPQSGDRFHQQCLMLSQFILGVLPGGPVAGHEDEVGEVGGLRLLLEDGVERFDGLAVGTPVRSILVLLAGDEDERAGGCLDQLLNDGFKLRKGDELCHHYSSQNQYYKSNSYALLKCFQIQINSVIMQLMQEGKHESSTQSSEEQRNFQSNLRLIQSEHLTPEMAVSYLFKWRAESRYIEPLLSRLHDLCLQSAVHYLPTVIFIMSLEENQLFERFCEKIAQASISHYLLVRWSYSTYLSFEQRKTQNFLAKLDSSLLRRNRQEAPLEVIQQRTKQKMLLSNYTDHVNTFFQKLFALPQRLKRHQKAKRNDKLREYLTKLVGKYLNHKCQYLDGIAFPISLDSSIAVNILIDQCFTFSTKERVPFKLVIESISYADAARIRQGLQPQFSQKEEQPFEGNSFILPQTYFGKEWRSVKTQLKRSSKWGQVASYQVRCYMVKSGDDLRQEYMAMQLISLFNDIFKKENIKIWIRPYSIVPYSGDSGLIQFIDDTRTISFLKEVAHQRSLKNIYRQIFGLNWESCLTNFIQSLAGYSLIQYYFDIKDRHNNNILVDVYGHIIHIDFSFMLSASPGNMNFQRAPFKLTADYVELMQGTQSDIFRHFKMLFFLGVKYLRKYKKEILELVMMMTECKGMKCFINFDRKRLEQKFWDSTTDEELEARVDEIITDACNSYTTSQYDVFQWFTNKIEI